MAEHGRWRVFYWIMGRFEWFRKWTGGYWWHSKLGVWWKHKDPGFEDYR